MAASARYGARSGALAANGASAETFGIVVVCWVLCDSLLTYLLRSALHVDVPVNAVLPLFACVAAVRWGTRAIPRPGILVVLALGFGTCIAGLALRGEADLVSIWPPVLAAAAFACGFFGFRMARAADRWGKALLAVGAGYLVVCAGALLQVAPALLPVETSAWMSDGGVLFERPAVTTDQNFQVMYLVPAFLVLALPRRTFRFAVATAIALGSMVVIVVLQSRSGIAVLAALFVLAIAARVLAGRIAHWRTAVLIVALGAVLAGVAPRVGELAAPALTRFEEGEGTAGRTESLEYVVDAVTHPAWWLAPHGEDDFRQTFGDVPHNQVTALFLAGGMPALVMWFALVALPLLALARLVLTGRGDPLATLVLLGGVALLVVQMSLNLAYFKQPWLWAGATLGTVRRLRAQPPAARPWSPVRVS